MNTTQEQAKVLIVDDDKFLLDMYAMKFTQAHYAVQTCLSVKHALEVIRGDFSPDIILFDLTMPEQDGFSFLKTLSQQRLAQGALKIALSNQNDHAEQEKAI